MKSIRMFLVVALVVVLASCGLKPMWDVIGKWQQVDGTATVEFLRNGTVNVVDGSTVLTAKYKFTEGSKQLEMDLGPLGTVGAQIAVAGDQLTLTNARGEALQFTKAK